MNNKLRPALISGVIFGLLSSIPYINLVNICCLWYLLSGAIAAYIYIRNSPNPVTVGEGAMLGLFSGVVSGLLYFLVGVPLNIAVGNPLVGVMIRFMRQLNTPQAEVVREQLERQFSRPFLEQWLSALPGALFGVVVIIALATVGGLIAIPLFEKRKAQAFVPPPPPGFGQ